MFKRANSTNNSAANPTYAFSQPNTAQASSAAARQQEAETFYQPLPAPAQQQQLPSRNPFTDEREYHSRTPSPSANATNPLLPSSVSPGMPAASRSYARTGGMPQRGESQSALLGNGDYRQPGSTRRYGPTASTAPVGPNAALLGSPNTSVSDKQQFGQDTTAWGQGLDSNPEADDYLHNPDPKRDRKNDRGGTIFTSRGIINIGCLFLLLLCLITLFAGYPIITFYTEHQKSNNGAYNLGGINSTGQVPQITNFPSLIDPDTPSNVMTRTGFDGEAYNLVFSDEFNKDGRTFFDGDDPFWTAVDFHYWPTGDFEWYDPSAITTKDGSLVLTMTQQPIHDLNFKSGMLQGWNKMCFQYSAYVEVSVSLPGTYEVSGFWPGVWMMGNLGRPGYGASTEGTWPYTYDSCDIGTLANQTYVNGTGPDATLTTGSDDGPLSYLPGQRLSACTCKGEDHPGPDVSKGRAAPELDIIEAQLNIDIPKGQVSQSYQVAPYDDYYLWNNATSNFVIYDSDLTAWNTYKGGFYQQAVSGLTYIDNDVYQLTNGDFNTYGVEYYTDPNNRDDGHITWVAGGQKSWEMLPAAIGPNARTEVGQRLIPEEPMAMIINLGMSSNFATVDFAHLQWPAHMLVDYIRVYQRSEGRLGCDPADHPTADYITNHANAYANANLTTWAEAGYDFPKNSLKDTC
ncbi:beta-glucan synthesis-associated protein-domain-containing protein [Naematelia encephala]|uniref:Beta-glucan synthesis-associated protein-domain-containing protein n=1 Tax=Naematelia encephala TaxID=71784 RepID=A0A1Y2AZ82_9TREE|nr:beta-glucan synthesis-associated protein-domain-containing protein [Naematelia encephala]